MTAPATAPANALNDTSSGLSAMQERFANTAVDEFLAGTPDPTIATRASEMQDYASVGGRSAFDGGSEAADGVPPITDKPRNEDGTFKKADAVVKATETAEEVTEGADAKDAKVDTPKEPLKLATDFELIGADGDPLDIADVMAKLPKTKFKVGDKEYEYPYDRVVRLAKSGIHNEKLYKDASEAIAGREVIEQRAADAEGSIERQNKFLATLFEDMLAQGLLENLAPNSPTQHFLSRWRDHNTPEARAERAERRLEEFQRQQTGQSQAASSASFYQNDVLSPIKALLQQFPSVTEEEIVGRFQLATAKYGAVIEPRHFEAVRAIISEDLPAYAASVHEKRSAHDTQLRKTQETNTLLKKRVAHGARPAGRVAGPGDGAAAPRPKGSPTSEANINDLIDRELAEMLR